jgi:Holin of 3TMs, for gene-transfer release
MPLSSESSAALLVEMPSEDRWTRRARPMFLYVIYAMILWALPVGIVAAFSPATARAMAGASAAYLNALPEPLYALFGTGYLGYATLRQWGKAKGTDR